MDYRRVVLLVGLMAAALLVAASMQDDGRMAANGQSIAYLNRAALAGTWGGGNPCEQLDDICDVASSCPTTTVTATCTSGKRKEVLNECNKCAGGGT